MVKVTLIKCGFTIHVQYYFCTMFTFFLWGGGTDVTYCFGLCMVVHLNLF